MMMLQYVAEGRCRRGHWHREGNDLDPSECVEPARLSGWCPVYLRWDEQQRSAWHGVRPFATCQPAVPRLEGVPKQSPCRGGPHGNLSTVGVEGKATRRYLSPWCSSGQGDSSEGPPGHFRDGT